VTFGVHTWVRARVTVEPLTEGRLPRPLRDREIKITPDVIQVQIWRSQKSLTSRIFTEPINLSRISDLQEFNAKLVVPQYLKLETDQPTEVKVKLEVVSEKLENTTTPPAGP